MVGMLWRLTLGDADSLGLGIPAFRLCLWRPYQSKICPMHYKIVGFLLAALLAFASVADAQTESPKLSLDSFSHDFGTLDAGTPLKYAFVIKNTGTAPLLIENVTPSCGCTTTDYDKVIPPGQEGKITLEVPQTSAYTGEVTKYATVHSNDPSLQVSRLTLHVFFREKPDAKHTAAGGAPAYTPVTKVGPFDISPSDKWTTSIIRGSTSPTTLRLKTRDSKLVHITSVKSGGDSFNVTLRTIQDGSDYALYIVTNPALKPGHYDQTIDVVTDSPGTDPVPISLDLTVYPEVIVTPAQIQLPPFPVKLDAASLVIPQIYVRKVRGTGLKITSVSSSLPFLQFEVKTELADQNYIVHATVDKSKLKGPGNYDGVIKIMTDDKEAPELDVKVKLSFS